MVLDLKMRSYLVEQGFKTIEDLKNCKDLASQHLNEKQMTGLKHYEEY